MRSAHRDHAAQQLVSKYFLKSGTIIPNLLPVSEFPATELVQPTLKIDLQLVALTIAACNVSVASIELSWTNTYMTDFHYYSTIESDKKIRFYFFSRVFTGLGELILRMSTTTLLLLSRIFVGANATL